VGVIGTIGEVSRCCCGLLLEELLKHLVKFLQSLFHGTIDPVTGGCGRCGGGDKAEYIVCSISWVWLGKQLVLCVGNSMYVVYICVHISSYLVYCSSKGIHSIGVGPFSSGVVLYVHVQFTESLAVVIFEFLILIGGASIEGGCASTRSLIIDILHNGVIHNHAERNLGAHHDLGVWDVGYSD